jgi:hypothetical protein
MRRKFAKKEGGRKAKSKGQVTKFSPETAAARDEGPRLIPLPESAVTPPQFTRESGGLPTNRYVALADIALRLWSGGKAQSAEPLPDIEAVPSRKTKR